MSAFLWFGVNQSAHAPLTDNGSRVGPGCEVREEKLNITRPCDFAVNAVIRSGFTANTARDIQFRRIVVGSRGNPLFIIKAKRDFRCIAGRARGCTGKDHVVHGAAAQIARRGFAHHPRQGFDKIGFAASVWADNACQTIFNKEFRGFYEGFKPGQS